jgi:4-hydroxy-tetrahydrodipicolinate reductase
MKLVLLGNGKTGSLITTLTKVDEIFDLNNLPTLDKLKKYTHAVSFLPGGPFLDLIDTLIEAKLDVVCGSTGFDIPSDLDNRLKKNKLTWCYSSNFSLGIGILRDLIRTLKKYDDRFSPSYKIIETHHITKKDKPSGTALSMKDWLGKDVSIESIREGHTVGIHEILVDMPTEAISIVHTAKSRSMFARGALWALNNLKKYPPGLIYFTKILEEAYE